MNYIHNLRWLKKIVMCRICSWLYNRWTKLIQQRAYFKLKTITFVYCPRIWPLILFMPSMWLRVVSVLLVTLLLVIALILIGMSLRHLGLCPVREVRFGPLSICSESSMISATCSIVVWEILCHLCRCFWDFFDFIVYLLLYELLCFIVAFPSVSSVNA